MKAFFALIFIFFTLKVAGQSSNFRVIETILTDINGDDKTDTIRLWSSIDENDFNKIEISITGNKAQYFIAKDSWTTVDSGFLKKNKNQINSKRFFLSKSKSQAVIMLFGYLDGAGYREEFSIINIQHGYSEMVLDVEQKDVDVEIPIVLADLDNDGTMDFVFTAYRETYIAVDSLNADIGTYCPYFVYSIQKPCVLNKPLTEKYNEDNYVFGGFKYDEEIKVLYPRDGSKPKIVK